MHMSDETPNDPDSSDLPAEESRSGQSTSESSAVNSGDSSSDPSEKTSSESTGSIEDMLLEYEEQDTLIRNRGLLDPNKVVDEERIVGRDEQLEEITKILRVAIGEDRPPNLFLYGPSGTGKSLIVNAVCNNLRKLCEDRNIGFGVIEMNCQDIGTLDETVYELGRIAANNIGVEHQVAENGVGTKQKWRELYRLISENYDTVVFVLDELDMLTGKRRNDGPAYSELLYQLSRAGSSNSMDANVSIAALTNDTKMLDTVGSRALSPSTRKMSNSTTMMQINFNQFSATEKMPSSKMH